MNAVVAIAVVAAAIVVVLVVLNYRFALFGFVLLFEVLPCLLPVVVPAFDGIHASRMIVRIASLFEASMTGLQFDSVVSLPAEWMTDL